MGEVLLFNIRFMLITICVFLGLAIRVTITISVPIFTVFIFSITIYFLILQILLFLSRRTLQGFSDKYLRRSLQWILNSTYFCLLLSMLDFQLSNTINSKSYVVHQIGRLVFYFRINTQNQLLQPRTILAQHS